MMKKMLIALAALTTLGALPAAHADGYWGEGDGNARAWHDTMHIHHDRREMQEAYWKRAHDVQEFQEAKARGDWDAMQHEKAEIWQDNARIAHEQQEVQQYRQDRWQANNQDWD